MMGDVITVTKSRTYAIQASLAMLMAAIFSTITFNVFGLKANFLFAPFIVLFLWPKGADSIISYFAIFLAGLLLDILTGAPLGGWALIYLPVFAILSQFSRSGETGFAETFVSFIVVFGAFGLFFLIAKLVNALELEFLGLLKILVICIFLFPVIYGIKGKLRTVLVNEEV